MKVIASALLLTAGLAFGADPNPLRLDLTPTPLAVTFTNTGTEPLRILKPLDGSEWCWIMPHYRLTVTDDRGQEVPFSIRCKLFGHPYSDTKWPDDYLVTIPAGGSYKHPLTANHHIKATGVFSLRFQYRFTPETNQFLGGTYPADLWRGEASSNTIKTQLEVSP
jgi:hypothetical protein